MNKRIEILMALRDYVDQGKNGRYEYVRGNDEGGKCYCAVGYIGNLCGIEDEVLKSNNSVGVGGHSAFHNGIKDLFFREELREIQVLNDSYERYIEGKYIMLDHDDPRLKSTLLKYIDKLIKETPLEGSAGNEQKN